MLNPFIRIAATGFAVLALVGFPAPETLAQQGAPSPQSIIEKLKPRPDIGRVRGFLTRGVSMEVPKELPSIDMRVNFEFGKATLTEAARETLSNLGQALISDELMGSKFELAGHTDAVGSEMNNLSLSDKRAAAAKAFLVETFGIDPARLTAKGYGESKLLKPDNPSDAINRRVQVTNVGQ